MQDRNTFLSKKMSYALRHNPDKYGIELDEYGYTDLARFIKALNRMHRFDPPVTETEIRKMMAQANKKRFEIKNGKICALYGHSVPGIVIRAEAKPPKVLYHGTARRFWPSIKENGLLPMGRQYVHLSADTAMAREVGLRRDNRPVILQVDAERAAKDGIKFYYASQEVWLCDQMPSKYLKVWDGQN